MRDEPDMTARVTRGEFREALELWGGAIIARIDELRTELRTELGRTEERLRTEIGRELGRLGAEVGRLGTEIRLSEDRLMVELRRHTTASAEQLRVDVSVLDEKYRDLPERTAKLEAKVFAPKRGRRS